MAEALEGRKKERRKGERKNLRLAKLEKHNIRIYSFSSFLWLFLYVFPFIYERPHPNEFYRGATNGILPFYYVHKFIISLYVSGDWLLLRIFLLSYKYWILRAFPFFLLLQPSSAGPFSAQIPARRYREGKKTS